jgi:hypothetical protein
MSSLAPLRLAPNPFIRAQEQLERTAYRSSRDWPPFSIWPLLAFHRASATDNRAPGPLDSGQWLRVR